MFNVQRTILAGKFQFIALILKWHTWWHLLSCITAAVFFYRTGMIYQAQWGTPLESS